MYIKISKNLSSKYHQENKESLKKMLVKDIKIFLRKKKIKSNVMNVMFVNVTKMSQKMKSKSLLRIEKNYYRMRKNASL